MAAIENTDLRIPCPNPVERCTCWKSYKYTVDSCYYRNIPYVQKQTNKQTKTNNNNNNKEITFKTTLFSFPATRVKRTWWYHFSSMYSCSNTAVSFFKDDLVHLECAWVETLSRERLQLQQTSGGQTGWVLHPQWTSTVPRVSLHEEEGDQRMASHPVSEIHSTIVLFRHTISCISDHSYHPSIAEQL